MRGQGAKQGSHVLYAKEIFNVDPNSGEIIVANDIVGGHHGALDYESGNTYAFIVEVKDKALNSAYVDVIVNLDDVNEPPSFIHGCQRSFALLACPTISEHAMTNIASTSAGMIYEYKSMNRLYYPQDSILDGPVFLRDDRLHFETTPGVRNVTVVSWNFYSYNSVGKSSVRIRYKSISNDLRLNVSLVQKNSSMIKTLYLRQTQAAIDSKKIEFNVTYGMHSIKLIVNNTGNADFWIGYMSIFTFQNERIYFVRESNNVLLHDVVPVTDNYFSPLLFGNFIGYGFCRGNEPWHHISIQILPLKYCNEECLKNSLCNYFAFDASSSTCILRSSCDFLSDSNSSSKLFPTTTIFETVISHGRRVSRITKC